MKLSPTVPKYLRIHLNHARSSLPEIFNEKIRTPLVKNESPSEAKCGLSNYYTSSAFCSFIKTFLRLWPSTSSGIAAPAKSKNVGNFMQVVLATITSYSLLPVTKSMFSAIISVVAFLETPGPRTMRGTRMSSSYG